MVIAKKCCEMGTNPSLFDFGAYLFGCDRIKRRESMEEFLEMVRVVDREMGRKRNF